MSRRGPQVHDVPLREFEEAGFAWIHGLHPVEEALAQRRRRIERIWVARERLDGRVNRVLRQAREAGIPVRYVSREVLARRLGRRAGTQGIAACVAPFSYADPDELCAAASARRGAVLLYVDRVQDPGNLGAILRTGAAAAIEGVLLSREETVGLSPTVVKASAGLLERLAVAREPHGPRRLRTLAERGFRVVGLDPRGDRNWDEVDLRERLLVVVGGEAQGLRPSLRRLCHETVRIPLAPGVDSLNVAVAVGVLLFEAVRQRRVAARGGAGC